MNIQGYLSPNSNLTNLVKQPSPHLLFSSPFLISRRL